MRNNCYWIQVLEKMSFWSEMSKSSDEVAEEKCAQNTKSSTKCRAYMLNIKQDTSKICETLTNRNTVWRFLGLLVSWNDDIQDNRLKNHLMNYWRFGSNLIPCTFYTTGGCQSWNIYQISWKLGKRAEVKFEEHLTSMFNITKSRKWIYSEDKELYKNKFSQDTVWDTAK